MKMKKVLAAMLAGTMVMASAATVFASETIVGDGWWTTGECATNEHSSSYTITGDGTWNIAVTTAGYSDQDGNPIAPAFCVEMISTVDEGTTYITSTCYADGWIAEAATCDEITGVTSGGNGASTYTGDIWAITVTREGQDFYLEYYQNDEKVIKQSFINTNFSEEVSLYLIAQTGELLAEITTDGSEASVDAYTEDWDYVSWAEENGYTLASADTESADTEASDDADAAEAAEDADDSTEESSGLSTGAIVAIVIVVIVVIAVIVVLATRKKK